MQHKTFGGRETEEAGGAIVKKSLNELFPKIKKVRSPLADAGVDVYVDREPLIHSRLHWRRGQIKSRTR